MSIAAFLLVAAGAALAAGHLGGGSVEPPKTAMTASSVTAADHGATDVFVKIPKNSTATVGTFDNVRILATCKEGGGFEQFEIRPLATGTDLKAIGRGNDGPVVVRNHDGGSISLNESASTRNERGVSTFSAARSGEPAVTGTLGYDTVSLDKKTVCAVYGEVVS